MFWDWVSRHQKHIVFALYGVLMVYGLSLLLWGLTDTSSQKTTVTIWITVGTLSALNSALGIYGTALDDACLVYASIVLLFFTCVAQILVIVVRLSMPAKPSEAEKEELFAMFHAENEEPFYQLEYDKKCCGVTDFNDYEEKFDPFLLGYPPSCCGRKSGDCYAPYEIGCHEVIMSARYRDEVLRAIIFLSSSFLKFASAIVIAILTIWGDDLVS